LAFGGVQQCPTQTLFFLPSKRFKDEPCPTWTLEGFTKKLFQTIDGFVLVLYWVHWTATLITWVRFLFRQSLSMMF
jgi:hypothetical protein